MIGALWSSRGFGGMGEPPEKKPSPRSRLGGKGGQTAGTDSRDITALRRRAGRNWRSRKRSWEGF